MVTLEDAKKYLGLNVNSTDKDTLVTGLISVASSLVSSYIGIDFTYDPSTTKYFNGNGYDTLKLPYYIADIDYLEIDGTEVLDYTNFYVEDNILYSKDGTTFTEGKKNIGITSNWGFEDTTYVPADLSYACLLTIGWLYQQNKDEVGVDSRSYNGMITTMTKEFPLPIRTILEPRKMTAL